MRVAPLVAARLYLVGDEDGGVALHCRDCWDGGRPVAYYETDPAGIGYAHDPLVENVTTISQLVTVAQRHEREVHG